MSHPDHLPACECLTCSRVATDAARVLGRNTRGLFAAHPFRAGAAGIEAM